MGNRYDADWQGVALALRQLKEIAEPSELDVLEKKQEFATQEREQSEKFQREQKSYDRAHRLVESMVEKGYEMWTEKQGEIEELRTNILDIDAGAEKLLKTEHSTAGFSKIFEDIDLKNLSDLEKIPKQVEQLVYQQLKTLSDYNQIHTNQKLGQQIYEQGKQGFKIYEPDEGSDKFDWDVWQNKTEGLEIAEDDEGRKYKEVTDWDIEGSIDGLERWEYEAAIRNIENEMQLHGEDTRGLRGGFYEGYKDSEVQSNLAEVQTSLAEFDRKEFEHKQKLKEAGPQDVEAMIKYYNSVKNDLDVLNKENPDLYQARVTDKEFVRKITDIRDQIILSGEGHRITKYDPDEGVGAFGDDEWFNDTQGMLGEGSNQASIDSIQTMYNKLNTGERNLWNKMIFNRPGTDRYENDPDLRKKIDQIIEAFKNKIKE
jgi:hypothetical protein